MEIGATSKLEFLTLIDLSLPNQLSTSSIWVLRTMPRNQTSGSKRSKTLSIWMCQGLSSHTVLIMRRENSTTKMRRKAPCCLRSSSQDTMHLTWFTTSLPDLMRYDAGPSENSPKRLKPQESSIQISKKDSFALKPWDMKTWFSWAMSRTWRPRVSISRRARNTW